MSRSTRSTTNAEFHARGPQCSMEQLIRLRHLASLLNQHQTFRSRSQLSGQHRSRLRGRGMDFDEVRLYQPGDDVRNIDWRVTARTSRAHTKIFRIEKERPVVLAVDQRAKMAFGSRVCYKSVMAAQLASLLGWHAVDHHDKVGGLVFHDQGHCDIKPQNNKHAVLNLIQALANFSAKPATQQQIKNAPRLEEALDTLMRITKPGSAIYILSDFHDYFMDGSLECERRLYLLRKHSDVCCIIINDNLERTLPIHGMLAATNGKDIIQFDSGKHAVQQQYQSQFDTRLDYLLASFQKLGVRSRHVMTDADPIRALQGLA